MEMLMKFAPASVATAFASIVLPVPGGPNKRMPLHGCMDVKQNQKNWWVKKLDNGRAKNLIILIFVIITTLVKKLFQY